MGRDIISGLADNARMTVQSNSLPERSQSRRNKRQLGYLGACAGTSSADGKIMEIGPTDKRANNQENSKSSPCLRESNLKLNPTNAGTEKTVAVEVVLKEKGKKEGFGAGVGE